MERFTEIAGIPIHYARSPVAEYGTLGKPRTSGVRATAEFRDKLARCLLDLAELHPLGKPTALVSAGFYVDKPGYHGQGRAVDIDSIWWGDKRTVALEAPSNPKRYLAIESVLRRHFGTVLNYWHNRSHRDHWHVDDGSTLAFNEFHTSRVKFVQASLRYVFNQTLEIDGIYGPITHGCVESVRCAIASELPTLDKDWTWFLRAVGLVGFGRLEDWR